MNPMHKSTAIEAVLFAVAALLVLAAAWSSAGFVALDYGDWGSDAARFTTCTLYGGAPCSLSKFPLAYLANAQFALHAGSEGGEPPLWILNLFFLSLPVVVASVLDGTQNGLAKGAAFMFAIALSPIPNVYVNSGALEIQAGIVSGMLMALALRLYRGEQSGLSTYLVAALLAFVAPLYKDTIALPLAVSLIGAVVIIFLWSRREAQPHPLFPEGSVRRVGLAVVLPLALGVAASLAYNSLRYGSIAPQAYLQEAEVTSPSIDTSIWFLHGIFFAPNGGVVVFWSLALFMALAFLVWRGYAPRRLASLAGIGMVLVSALAFSRWWAPFGWDSWGNRLMIQPMLCLLVLLVLDAQPTPVTATRWARNALLIMLPLALWSVTFVAIPYLLREKDLVGLSMNSGPECKSMIQALQHNTSGMSFWRSESYYRCARERMFTDPRAFVIDTRGATGGKP